MTDDEMSPTDWLRRGIEADDREREAEAAAAGDEAALRAMTGRELDTLLEGPDPESPPANFDQGARASAPAPEPEPGLDRIRRAIAEGS